MTGCWRLGGVSILPLVEVGSDLPGPWVPALGADLADAAATGLRGKGFGGAVLDTADMAMRLSQVNIEKVSLAAAEAVAAAGDRMGVDVVVFGRMKREKDPGAAFLEVVKVDLQAYGFQSGGLVAHATFDLRSDSKENKRAFAAARNDSLWMPGTEWQVPSPEKGFDQELKVVTGILAKRLLQGIDVADLKGALYLPPADTGRFVRSVAKLRAAQVSFAFEYARRAKEVMKGESPLAVEKPVTLDGGEFKTLH